MKKKIGEIYDKPIVIGNKNEVTKNEVHVDQLGGESFDDGIYYYLVVKRMPVELGKVVAPYANTVIYKGEFSGDIAKLYTNGHKCDAFTHGFIAFSIYGKYDSGPVDAESTIEILNSVLEDNGYLPLDENTEYFKRITAKEYYFLLK